MHTTSRWRFAVFATTALLALAACQRSEPAATAPSAATLAPPATIEAPVAATMADPVGVSAAPAPGEHTTFDAKAFAGEFADDNVTIRFAADGTYARSSPAADASTGTWTLEPDGHSLRLDPNAKDEADRVYALVSNDEIKAANGPQVLKRK
jgi:hypothetical protein